MKNSSKIISILVGILLFGIMPGKLSAQYTEKDIYAYITQYQDIAIKKMNEYKIPASITIAQGIYESACGKSHLAVDGNNHFGIKCHQDWVGDTILIDDDELQECFRKYNSVEESFSDHSLFLKNRKRYANLFELEITDYAAWAHTLKADGYATNPKYADQLISIIERFKIARLDTIYLVQYCGYNPKQAPAAETVAQVKEVKPTADVPNVPTTPKQDIQTAPLQSNSTPLKAPAAQNTIQSKNDSQMKVFTALGSEYPSGASPFTYRKVFENNKTYFVIAQKGDTYESIAGDVQVAASSLRKFNDVAGNGQPRENEIVYIESKAKSSPTKAHIVVAGETLRYIAQRYGVQLEYIFKYNNLDENSIIHPGDQILLRH